MPVLRLVIRVDKEDHANDALHVVRDAGAGNHPPTKNTDDTHGKGGETSISLGGEDVREVVLACHCPNSLVNRFQQK